MATNNIQAIQEWCEQARKLLKTTKKGFIGTKASEESEALKKHINTIAGLLQKITADPAMASVYGPLQERFRALGARMEQLAKTVSAERGKDEAKKTQAQLDLNNSFQLLEDDINAALPLLEARKSYMAEYQKTLAAVKLLGVTPFADAKPLNTKLEKIHDQAQQGNVDGYTLGQKSLKALLTDIQKEKTTAADKRKASIKQLEKKPEATKKLSDAADLLAQIRELVGVSGVAGQYHTIIEAAKKLGETDQWREALTKLEELNTLPKLDALKKTSTKQEQSLQSIPEYKKGSEQLAEARTLMPADAVKALEKTFKAAGSQLIEHQGKVKSEDQKALVQAVKAINDVVAQRKLEDAELQKLSLTLTNLIAELRNNANPLNILEDEFGFNTFTTLYTSKMLPEALDKGRQIEVSMGAKRDTVVQDKTLWNQVKGKQPGLVKGLRELFESSCKAVGTRSRSTEANITNAEVTRLEELREWAQLTRKVNQAEQTLTELKNMHQGHGGLGNKRDEAHKQFEQKRKALVPAITQFDQAVVTACGKAGLPALDAGKRFIQLIEGVAQTWALAMANSSDENTLNAALETALQGLANIEKRLSDANTPEGIQAAVGDHGQEQVRPEFERAWAEFEEQQRQCQALDNATAQELARRGLEVRKLAPPDWKAALEALTELSKKATTDLKVAGNAQAGLQQTILTLGKAALDEINLAKASNKNAKQFADTLKALLDEHAELLLLGKSTNVDALHEAEQGLKELKVRASKLIARQDGRGISLDKVYTVYEMVDQQRTSATDHLSANDPKALTKLTDAWLKLKAELFSLEPEAALKKLNTFMGEIEGAKLGADKVVQTRVAYEDLLPATKQMLTDLTKRKVVPEYTKQLTARLKDIEKKAEVPGTLYEALTAIKVLGPELFEANSDIDKAMAKEKGVLDAKHQDEVTLKTYERSRALCEDKYIKEAKAAVEQSKGDKAMLKELSRMLSMAKQSHKEGDVTKALQQVELTIERAKQIVANPYGPAIGSRNNLPKDKQVWTEAITAFQLSLDTIKDKTLNLLTDQTVHDDVKKAMEGILTGLKNRFDPMAFDNDIVALNDDSADDKALRAARESALSKVRNYQSVLAKHPHVKKLLQNPAAKSEASVAYRRMQSALTRLEANFSRCVR